MAKAVKTEYHWPILGHSEIKHYLQSCLNHNTLAHAYLFFGPKSVGKYLMAKNLGASVLCLATDQKRPCNLCQNCLQLGNNTHPDVDIVRKEEDKKDITIDQIRRLQHKLSLKSFLTKYKIAIIDNADNLNEESANALLKTLEEPTPQTLIILIAENKNSLLPTIISRCQQIQFNLLPSFQIENWLLLQGATKKEANIITRLTQGKPGQAVTYLNNKVLLDQRLQKIKQLADIINGTLNDRFHIINTLTDEANSDNSIIADLISEWISFFRDIILNRINSHFIVNLANQPTIELLSRKFSARQLHVIMAMLLRTKKMLSQSINPRLALENCILYF